MTYTQANTVSGTGYASTTPPNSSNGYSGIATVRQLVYDFQHTRDMARQARALETVARGNLTKVEADLVLQVKQSFYALAQANRLVAANEANVDSANAHLALAKARLNSGMGLPSDVVRAEAAVSEALLSLNLARNTASLARVTLANGMGIDVRTPVAPADSDEAPMPGDDVNALMEAALLHRPEMLQAKASLDASLAAVRAAKTTSAPSIAGTVSVGAKNTNFFPNNDSVIVGGTVTWNILDAGYTAGKVHEAQGNVETAQAQFTTTRQNVMSDVAQAYLNLRSAEQRVETAKAEVANSGESVRLAEGRYKAGIGTFLDVTDAQSALLLAQTNQINALAAVDSARATLAHAVGASGKKG
jgi:outer membrane protein TolC